MIPYFDPYEMRDSIVATVMSMDGREPIASRMHDIKKAELVNIALKIPRRDRIKRLKPLVKIYNNATEALKSCYCKTDTQRKILTFPQFEFLLDCEKMLRLSKKNQSEMSKTFSLRGLNYYMPRKKRPNTTPDGEAETISVDFTWSTHTTGYVVDVDDDGDSSD